MLSERDLKIWKLVLSARKEVAEEGANFQQGNPFKGPNKPRTKEKCPPGSKKDKSGNCLKR